MSFISSNSIEERYNWADVKSLAEKIFFEYSSDIHWAEDVWNLLMFNSAVKEKNIVPRNLNSYQIGDATIWLLTLYKFYFDYKCIIKDETAYYDHDVGINGFATYRNVELFDKIYNIESGNKCITEYLWDDVFNKLNGFALDGVVPVQDFYDTESKCFSFSGLQYETIYHSEAKPSDDSIAKIVLLEEMELRREYFIDTIYKSFDYNDMKILEFLTGYRWVEEYSEYKQRKAWIEGDYRFRKKVFQEDGNEGFKKYVGYESNEYESIDEIDEEMNSELELLDDEYLEWANHGYNYKSEILDWIGNSMCDI